MMENLNWMQSSALPGCQELMFDTYTTIEKKVLEGKSRPNQDTNNMVICMMHQENWYKYSNKLKIKTESK